MIKRLLAVLFPALLLAISPPASTGTFLILHTNDIHDHVRPGYNGMGGLPYVSGYIKNVLAQRKDVLVLDGGDVMEKGDMVADGTHSRLTYESMAKAGYAAVALGNHDLDNGVAHLLECQKLAPGMSMLCLNLIPKEGRRPFPASKVFEVGGLRIAVIGLAIPRGGEFLDLPDCAAALEKEAQRLEATTHLQVALCHIGSRDCAAISALAPSVDIFVGGHTHEITPTPIRVQKSGALIVQAGQYAQNVGRLELTVDLAAKKIVSWEGRIVRMQHDSIPCDDAMRHEIERKERALFPKAARVIARTERALPIPQAARIAAAAMLRKGKAEVAFCHAGQILRSELPSGPIDVNAVFLTGGQRGREIIALKLKGREIETYLKGLREAALGMTEWAGFRCNLESESFLPAREIATDLRAEKSYKVVMPRLEWETRFLRVFAKRFASPQEAEKQLGVVKCGFNYTEAAASYIEALTRANVALEDHLKMLSAERVLQPVAVR